jgi:hypothetical protein
MEAESYVVAHPGNPKAEDARSDLSVARHGTIMCHAVRRRPISAVGHSQSIQVRRHSGRTSRGLCVTLRAEGLCGII